MRCGKNSFSLSLCRHMLMNARQLRRDEWGMVVMRWKNDEIREKGNKTFWIYMKIKVIKLISFIAPRDRHRHFVFLPPPSSCRPHRQGRWEKFLSFFSLTSFQTIFFIISSYLVRRKMAKIDEDFLPSPLSLCTSLNFTNKSLTFFLLFLVYFQFSCHQIHIDWSETIKKFHTWI